MFRRPVRPLPIAMESLKDQHGTVFIYDSQPAARKAYEIHLLGKRRNKLNTRLDGKRLILLWSDGKQAKDGKASR